MVSELCVTHILIYGVVNVTEVELEIESISAIKCHRMVIEKMDQNLSSII